MNMRPPPPGNDSWINLEDAKAQGLLVALLEDRLNGYEDDIYLHPTTQPATKAVLVTHGAQTLPGLLLADGSVVPISWMQLSPLISALCEFGWLTNPKLIERFGMCRASIEVTL